MGKVYDIMKGLKPILLMLMVQAAYAGVNIFYKLAANDGMNLRIIVAYRLLFASAFMAAFALVVERKSRPKMTKMVLIQAFFSGLFGATLSQNLYVSSLVLTSATFATAMTNLVPAITFIMAMSCGLEILGIKSLSGKAKVLGTVLGISGAMVLTFYKGVAINIWSTNIDLLHKDAQDTLSHSHSNGRLLGSIYALGSCFAYSLWLIIQAKMNKRYPCHYSSIALMCVMGSIQSVIFALCTERDWSQWKLGWNIRLLSVSYMGVVGSGLMNSLIALCVRMRGPLFASVFNPLLLVLVALAGSLLLNEELHLGSILGGVLIVLGLYSVLWGKAKEMKKIEVSTTSEDMASKPTSIEITMDSNQAIEEENVDDKEENEKKSKESNTVVVVKVDHAVGKDMISSGDQNGCNV